MLGFGSVVCPKCGAKAARGDSFCRNCGEGLPTGEVKCGSCQGTMAADAAFCPHCGTPAAEGRAPRMTANRWARKVGEFATRIEETDVQGFLRKPLIVDSGLRALCFAGGRFAGDLPAGTYNMGGILQRVADLGATPVATMVLVDASDTEITFWVENVRSADPLQLSVRCQVVVRVAEPILFLNNAMKGRQGYSEQELADSLRGEVRNALHEYVAQRRLDDLVTPSVDAKSTLQAEVERHLRTTLHRNGLDLIQVRVLDFQHAGVDEVVARQEATVIRRLEEEAALTGETQDVSYYRRRAEVWDQMRQALADNEMRQIRTEEELRDFHAEIDKAGLIREDEIAAVARTLAERNQDHELARAHLLGRLDLERKLELARIELNGRLDLDAAQRDHELAERRKLYLAQLQEQEDVFRQGLAQQAASADEGIRQLGGLVDLQRRKKAADREDEEARLQMQAEHLARLSQLGPEALLLAADTDKARLIAELRRTEMLKGFSEEQILAMSAENSPEIARAFQEKFRAMAPEALAALYDRMLADRDKAAADRASDYQEFAGMMSRVMETMAQAGRAPGSTVVVPGREGIVLGEGGAARAERVVVCTKCHAEVPVGIRFCTSCGNQIA